MHRQAVLRMTSQVRSGRSIATPIGDRPAGTSDALPSTTAFFDCRYGPISIEQLVGELGKASFPLRGAPSEGQPRATMPCQMEPSGSAAGILWRGASCCCASSRSSARPPPRAEEVDALAVLNAAPGDAARHTSRLARVDEAGRGTSRSVWMLTQKTPMGLAVIASSALFGCAGRRVDRKSIGTPIECRHRAPDSARRRAADRV
jgi:hypothetical protein